MNEIIPTLEKGCNPYDADEVPKAWLEFRQACLDEAAATRRRIAAYDRFYALYVASAQ